MEALEGRQTKYLQIPLCLLCTLILSIIFWWFYAYSTYNYVGCHFNELISAFNKGDLTQAREIQVTFQIVFFFLTRPLTCSINYDLTSFFHVYDQFKLQELLSNAIKLGESIFHANVFLLSLKKKKGTCGNTNCVAVTSACVLLARQYWVKSLLCLVFNVNYANPSFFVMVSVIFDTGARR